MKFVQDFEVSAIHQLNPENYIITLSSTHTLPPISPGNFAELKVDNTPNVFLRRPFSILNVDHEKNEISFYIKIIGKGTRKLGKLVQGDKVNIIFPLGNSFSYIENSEALIIGGGSGIAPFILLGRELQKRNNKLTFLIGGRKKGDIFFVEEFSRLGEVCITTEDGSMGERGLVTQHPVYKTAPEKFSMIYTCGPEPMMKAVGEFAKINNIPCEVSLENDMACGFGACLCCIVATTDGNKCVCTEGPVFNINDLKW